jgi:hypothetical protein
MNDNTDGFNIPLKISEQLSEAINSEVLDFLKQWAELTRKSLLANKEVIFNCLTIDSSDGHILCRFCGEGIPNWKQENSREHKSECPTNSISEVLRAVKKMHTELNENVENKTLN